SAGGAAGAPAGAVSCKPNCMSCACVVADVAAKAHAIAEIQLAVRVLHVTSLHRPLTACLAVGQRSTSRLGFRAGKLGKQLKKKWKIAKLQNEMGLIIVSPRSFCQAERRTCASFDHLRSEALTPC